MGRGCRCRSCRGAGDVRPGAAATRTLLSPHDRHIRWPVCERATPRRRGRAGPDGALSRTSGSFSSSGGQRAPPRARRSPPSWSGVRLAVGAPPRRSPRFCPAPVRDAAEPARRRPAAGGRTCVQPARPPESCVAGAGRGGAGGRLGLLGTGGGGARRAVGPTSLDSSFLTPHTLFDTPHLVYLHFYTYYAMTNKLDLYTMNRFYIIMK